jgi:hypothetical protein
MAMGSEMTEISVEDRIELARAVVAIMDEWGVAAGDQLAILGFPEDTPPRKLRLYRDETPLPDDAGILQRVEHVIHIADALRTTYPVSRNMRSMWMHRPVRRLRSRTPVSIMVEDGLDGIIRVRSHLDCSYMWDATGSSAAGCR